MGKSLCSISILVVGACVLVLVNQMTQCQGAKYVNSLDLNEDELTSLLDELSLPQHRLVKDRSKTFSWFSLHPEASRLKHVFYEHEKPTSRRRRIAQKRHRQLY